MLKRAYLSVTRRRGKVIILAVILFVIANLVLSSITIGNATNEAMEYARASLGGEVSLTTDMSALRDMMHNAQEEDGEFKRIDRPDIYLEDVEAIASSEYVIDYTYGFSFNADAVDFEAVETDTSASDEFGRGMSESSGDISIQSINAYALISDVINGNIELVEGETFDETNEDDIIISYELALLNDLNVGDTIEIETIEYDDETVTKSFNIIGIYDELESDDDTNNFRRDPANTMYTNIASAIDILNDDEYNDGNYIVTNVKFYLDDPVNSDLFTTEANSLVTDLEDRNLILDVNSSLYEQMVGPIEGVKNASSSIMLIVIIAAIAILSLLIINQIKDRKYEIGVLLSLGEKKGKISLQLLTELIIVASAAFLLSLGTSSFIAQKLGNNLLANQIEMNEESSDNYMGRGMGAGQFDSVHNTVDAIDEIDIKASYKDYLLLFGLGYLIIAGSLIIPTIQILKYEPKTILTGREN